MREDKGKRGVWLYDGDHPGHPFICQAAASLVDAGYSVSVLDRAIKSTPARYQHIALGHENSWLQNLVRIMNRIKQRSDFPVSVSASESAPLPSYFSVFSAKSPAGLPWRLLCRLYLQASSAMFLARVLLQTIVLRPSVIIATLPNVTTMGWLAAGLWQSRLVYYPFELYGDQHAEAPFLWKRFESLLLSRGIDALITQNEERARIYLGERNARGEPG